MWFCCWLEVKPSWDWTLEGLFLLFRRWDRIGPFQKGLVVHILTLDPTFLWGKVSQYTYELNSFETNFSPMSHPMTLFFPFFFLVSVSFCSQSPMSSLKMCPPGAKSIKIDLKAFSPPTSSTSHLTCRQGVSLVSEYFEWCLVVQNLNWESRYLGPLKWSNFGHQIHPNFSDPSRNFPVCFSPPPPFRATNPSSHGGALQTFCEQKQRRRGKRRRRDGFRSRLSGLAAC